MDAPTSRIKKTARVSFDSIADFASDKAIQDAEHV